MTTRIALPCTLAALALAVSACSGGSATSTTSSTTASSAAASSTATDTATAGASTAAGSTAATGPLTVQDPWVKAVKGGMTGVFGTLKNDTDKDVKIVKATSPVSDMVQLHVTEKDASGAMVMKETEGGFVVPAHGTFELKPGGNHVMLMGLKGPILSGTDTALTLVTEDGATVEITAPAREFNGAKETYGGMSMTPNQTAPGASATTSSGH